MSNPNFLDKYYDHACDVIGNDLMSAKFKGKVRVFPNKIMVIGAGGTSSWFAPKFAKIINDALRKNLVGRDGGKISIIYVDGDHIEDKNLIRQNFVEFDIGKNKAEVIATRYGSQFNQEKVECKYIDKYITNGTYRKIDSEVADKFIDVKDVYGSMQTSNILFINLIDNAVTRKIIHLTAIDCGRAIVLDVANNEHNGQLTTSLYNRSFISSDSMAGWFYNSVPEQLGDTDDVSVFSCADADADSEDQLFNANDMAATVLANYVNTWLVEKKMDNARVDFNTGSRVSIGSSIPLLKSEIIDPRYFPEHDSGSSFAQFIDKAMGSAEMQRSDVSGYSSTFSQVRKEYKKRILDSL